MLLALAASATAHALDVNGVTCEKSETIAGVTACLTRATLDGGTFHYNLSPAGAAIDLDQDGAPDLILSPNLGVSLATPTPVNFFRGAGNGRDFLRYAPAISGYGDVAAAMFVRNVVVGDFNNDGRQDFYLADATEYRSPGNDFPDGATQYAYIATGAGTFAKVDLGMGLKSVHGPAAGDQWNDGFGLVLNTPWQPIFSSPNLVSVVSFDGAISVAAKGIPYSDPLFIPFGPDSAGFPYLTAFDVNGDGARDVVMLGRWGNDTNVIWLNDGRGNFTLGKTLTNWDSRPQQAENAEVADLNGDGLLDMIVMHIDHTTDPRTLNSTLRVWINDGNGGFSDQTATWLGSRYQNYVGGYFDYRIVDLDGDGRPDVVFTTQPTRGPYLNVDAQVTVLKNQGGTGFDTIDFSILKWTEPFQGAQWMPGSVVIMPVNGKPTVLFSQAGVVHSLRFAPDVPVAPLSLRVTGPGAVASTPSGIACGTSCVANFAPGTSVTLTATPSAGSFFGGWGGACTGTGDCTVTMNAARAATATFAPNVPGIGTITANPYGPISVQGELLAGNTITSLQPNATLQLGTVPGTTGSRVEIALQGLNVGPGATLTVMSGAPGQTVVLADTGPAITVIGGALRTQGGNGAPAPVLVLHNPKGISIPAGGAIVAPAGVGLDALDDSETTGRDVFNAGTVDGGPSLALYGANVKGGGAYKGNAILLATHGNANNPVHGPDYLSNGLQFYPSSGGDVMLSLNHFGAGPQVLNAMVNGNATVSMPSAWPPAALRPPNNPPVLAGGSRLPGASLPGYGAGSVIVQATGGLALDGGDSGDFVFPGGIVLKAGGTLDVNGVTIDNGWYAVGKPFQGVYFESPSIISSGGPIQVLTNALNWVNFSTMPHASVRTWQLTVDANGVSRFVASDSIAPHLNVYSTLIEAAAAGQCWVCLVNTAPVNLQ